MSTNNLPLSMRSIWFIKDKKYYLVGDGIFSKTGENLLNKNWEKVEGIQPNYYSNSIDGTGYNDIIVCGAFGEIIHYNGFSWKNYLVNTLLTNGSYYAVKKKGNKVIVVGESDRKGIITVGEKD
jgi:hypothetical protein